LRNSCTCMRFGRKWGSGRPLRRLAWNRVYTSHTRTHTNTHTQTSPWVVFLFLSSWQPINHQKNPRSCLRLFLCDVQHVYPIMKFVSVYLRTFTQSMCGFLSMWLPFFVPRVLKRTKAFLAHFFTVTTVNKTDTDIFCRCMVLNASWQVRDTNLKPGRIQVCVSEDWTFPF